MRSFYILGLIITTVACTSAPATQKANASDSNNAGVKEMKRLETLHAVKLKKETIEVSVTGHGCTQAKHFEIQVAHQQGKCQVSIYRTQFDPCRRSSMPITLALPWDAKKACGEMPIDIVNPQKSSSTQGIKADDFK